MIKFTFFSIFIENCNSIIYQSYEKMILKHFVNYVFCKYLFVLYRMNIFESNVLLLTRLRAPFFSSSSDVRTIARSSRHTSRRRRKSTHKLMKLFEDFTGCTYMKIIHSINFCMFQVECIQIREHRFLMTFSIEQKRKKSQNRMFHILNKRNKRD
jgi:hypothetical protein